MMLIINTFKFDYNLKQDDFAKTLVKDYFFYKFGFSGFSSTKSLVTNMKMDFLIIEANSRREQILIFYTLIFDIFQKSLPFQSA